MNPRAHKRFLCGALLVFAFVAPEGLDQIASGLGGPYGDRHERASARVVERMAPAASPGDLLALQMPDDRALALTDEILRPGM